MSSANAEVKTLPGLTESKNLESYAKHEKGVFNSLTKTIKEYGKMFAFGKPTLNMINLMTKVYHENTMRTLTSIDKCYEKEEYNKETQKKEKKKLRCMFGIMEDESGSLYVTISETPGYNRKEEDDTFNSPSDSDYNTKKAMMIKILECAKVKISYPEETGTGKNKSPFVKPISPAHSLWRRTEAGESENLIDHEEIVKKINANKALQDVIFLDRSYESDKINVYDKAVRDLNVSVNWVDSWEYLRNRTLTYNRNNEGKPKIKNGELVYKTLGPTFKPFKKYKLAENGKTWQTECNNGHLCTEAKIFAYAFLHGIKVKSFVAYWIGNSPPPESHILPSYCYRTTNKYEKGKLEQLLIECKPFLNLMAETSYNKFWFDKRAEKVGDESKIDIVLSSVIQPAAVACPGCFANIDNYIKGNMEMWNSSNCYRPRIASGVTAGGAKKKKTQRKSRKGKKATRKTH